MFILITFAYGIFDRTSAGHSAENRTESWGAQAQKHYPDQLDDERMNHTYVDILCTLMKRRGTRRLDTEAHSLLYVVRLTQRPIDLQYSLTRQ
mmetsp:Transcript_12749/g.20645  ORF Transcript_12749/g.20645 Transcript_12749/m.20645 type:complete len:93 (+) Transcript_12749:671-949(+)